MSSAAVNSNGEVGASERRSALLWPIIGAAAGCLAVLALLVYFSQGGAEELPITYGQRRGVGSAGSVNGTSVLAEMFKQAGHRVTSLDELSPRLEKFDILVWFPNDFEPPTAEQREFLEQWLSNGDGRTLVYVGRDYDAAPAYWKKIQPLAKPAAADEVQRELARAQAKYDTERVKMPKQQYARWFTARRDGKRREIRKLQGPWAAGVDASQVEIALEGRLDVPKEKDRAGTGDPELPTKFETLLKADGDVLVSRATDDDWSDGQVLVVANGSFVLNYPLVNHEHRRLASLLVSECGAAGNVAFIESDAGGPEVTDKEPEAGMTNGLALLKVWPLNAILLHLTVLGIVLCIARSAIFGRPRELPSESRSDFGQHVAALGLLLSRTRNRAYALARLQQYRDQAQRGSGKSHRVKK